MKVPHLRTLSLLAAWCFLTFTAGGQDKAEHYPLEPARSQLPVTQTTDMTDFARISAEIKKKLPNISDQMLLQDAALVRSSLPVITTEFSRIGLSEDDALWAALRGWRSVRLESPLGIQNPMDESSFVTHVTNDFRLKVFSWHLRNENPEISSSVLKRDVKLINQAQPEIAAAFSQLGWNDADARKASLVAWKEVRLDSELKPDRSMNRASFIAFVTNHLGTVAFYSEPDQAEVFQGARKIGTTSKDKSKALFMFFQDGEKVTVLFSKPQFVSEQRECFAKARETVDCRADLRPQ